MLLVKRWYKWGWTLIRVFACGSLFDDRNLTRCRFNYILKIENSQFQPCSWNFCQCIKLFQNSAKYVQLKNVINDYFHIASKFGHFKLTQKQINGQNLSIEQVKSYVLQIEYQKLQQWKAQLKPTPNAIRNAVPPLVRVAQNTHNAQKRHVIKCNKCNKFDHDVY